MGRSGTGLGMAVVWGTVEDHKGSISVASKEGRGTTFKLLFPACDQPKLQPILTSLTEEQFQGHGQTVLVVDDSEDQRQIASDILNRLGYMATTVADGEEAVEYLRHTVVDLVLLDMLMAPGIDGLETFRRIREFRPDQKAIIASGYSHSARIETAMSFGISEYVVKPYTVKCIGQAVHSTLMAS
jgi:CheY-like chemotaxis protein